jgi:hypothetical protein
MGAGIVVCSKCGAKNRVPEFTAKRIPVCGNCKSELPEPALSFWHRKTSPWIGAIAVAGLFVSIPLIVKLTESKAPESAVVAKVAPDKTPWPSLRPVLQPDGPLSRFPDANPELTVLTPDDDQRYFIMLAPIGEKSKSLKYLASGRNSFTVHVPSGRYKFMYATGPVWYGETELFGQETICSDGKDTIEFLDDGDKYSTNTITLHKITNGNFHTLPMSVEQFRRFM